MLNRPSGGLTFMTIRDSANDMQIAVSKKRASEKAWGVTKLLDLGDIVVVRGNCCKSKTGEPTVWAEDVKVVSKSLLPPPAKHEGLTDTELRYRKRYLDLYSNPKVAHVFRQRARIIGEIRRFLGVRRYLEVETPMMHPVLGGAAAKPFITHHNALDMPLYMRIAPELYLKRLLVGGMEKVYEINRNFRNEGISTKHNPEFTMLEAYCAYENYEGMMTLVEAMITDVAHSCDIAEVVKREGENGVVVNTNLTRPWRRVKLWDIVAEVTGWHYGQSQPLPDSLISSLPTKVGDATIQTLSEGRKLVLLYEKLVEPTLIDPTFVTHFPAEIMPLAKKSREFGGFAEVFELAINGMEVSPGYTEQNDPGDQINAFLSQGGELDTDFIEALKHGMPPAGGVGVGIDRLVMALLGQESARDVILFPLLKMQQ